MGSLIVASCGQRSAWISMSMDERQLSKLDLGRQWITALSSHLRCEGEGQGEEDGEEDECDVG
jgi:hypothetical protein